jgi:tRNA (guanine37-N1)-methyltransferase
MIVHIITLFPEMFSALASGIPGRAQKQKRITLHFYNPRDFAHDKHRTVDDRPYGGGPGMVMKVQPLRDAIHAAKKNSTARVSYLSPQGKIFDENAAKTLSTREELILVAGRYEGIDERLITTDIDEEWSVGDFVLSGGELAAMCLIDAVTRLLPGALGDEQSAEQDSFSNGLLDYPHYTRPEEIDNLRVPEVLLRGDHAAIARWRLKQSLGRTALRRPDLLKKHSLTAQEQVLLAEFLEGHPKT